MRNDSEYFLISRFGVKAKRHAVIGSRNSREAPYPLAVAAVLIERKQFELSKDSIFKILYEEPGVFFGGHVIFESVGEQIQVEISVLSVWNPSSVQTVRKLVESLLIFAPDRFYDENTGARVRDNDLRL